MIVIMIGMEKKNQELDGLSKIRKWLRGMGMPRNTEHQTCFPKLTPQARNVWKMAKARDQTIEKNFGAKACGKDTRAFYFLMGYWMGESH